jgi:Uncharacterised nucleotidyltransferase
MVAVRNLLVDRVTSEVVGWFAEAGIDCMLVKGPVIAELLYAEPRPYGDSDILVRRSDWHPAISILLSHGFHDALAPMAHPRMESFASTAFVRGSDNVDLHCTLAGLDATPEEVWEALSQSADRQEVGGRVVAVPGRPAVLMHLALHAVHHHANEKPLEDLRRGIADGGVADWRLAARLADRLGGASAFASGLRRLPEGETLAATLGVERFGSLHFELRTAGVPTAEGLHELFVPGLTLAQRVAMVLAELFPKPSFMRWWTPLARRGDRGLIASYPLRWAWLAINVPRGALELQRARRRRDAS